MKLLSAILLSLGLSVSVWADDKGPDAYLCITEQSGGIYFDGTKGEWDSTTFKTGEKFLVRRSKPSDGVTAQTTWLVYEFGTDHKRGHCGGDIDPYLPLLCNYFTSQFQFYAKTLRFQLYMRGSYIIDGENDGGDTPSISVGRCSPL